MSIHVLLNLLSKLGKRDKMGGFAWHCITFPHRFDKFKCTGAQIIRFCLSNATKNTLKSPL